MSTADIAVVPAAVVGDIVRLEPLARAVFGDGQRSPGWFALKLARECVIPEHSRLLTRSADATDPDAWVGYGLLGRPPSLGTLARTAGIGLLPGHRGQGLGKRLLDALVDSAARTGASALRVPSSPAAQGFYSRCGLQPAHTTHTLLAFGCANTPTLHAAERWDSPCPGPVAAAWFREGWERTPTHRRHTVRTPGNRFDVSMEGSAHVAMRWTSEAATPDSARSWLRRVPAGTPALLHAVRAEDAVSAALVADGWTRVQTTVAMQTTAFSTRR